MRTAIYAGSFDPITLGHIWVINQALKIFDKVYIAIGVNSEKKSTFSLADRKVMIENSFSKDGRIEIISFDKEFIANVCRDNKIDVMIRGVRNVKDFEYEQQIQYINEKINSKVQTIYLFPPTELAGLSSSLVKGLIGFSEWNLQVDKLIPKVNMKYMYQRCYMENFDYNFNDVTSSIGYYLRTGKEEFKKTIVDRYCEPHRYYHTLQHINEMLELNKKSSNRDLAGLAIIFHDIVYDPKRHDNEEESVRVFKNLFKVEEYNSSENIENLIMATKNHTHSNSNNRFISTIIDLDLYILGSEPTRFNEYEKQIRAEYNYVSDELYKKGRIDFINSMLSKDNIYSGEATSLDYKILEKRAKENLRNLLEKLKNEKSDNSLRLDCVE